jgi:hypothetical protein
VVELDKIQEKREREVVERVDDIGCERGVKDEIWRSQVLERSE